MDELKNDKIFQYLDKKINTHVFYTLRPAFAYININCLVAAHGLLLDTVENSWQMFSHYQQK
jgi:hypothetical protein